jgi:hypothetical protein
MKSLKKPLFAGLLTLAMVLSPLQQALAGWPVFDAAKLWPESSDRRPHIAAGQ